MSLTEEPYPTRAARRSDCGGWPKARMNNYVTAVKRSIDFAYRSLPHAKAVSKRYRPTAN
jgi:hypothetical protein